MATRLWNAGAVKEPLFSRGTYQIEVHPKGKAKLFPFIQISDQGEVLDSFCSCEAGGNCVHLAAAYLRIYNGFDEPLHVRFKKSLWNRLCQMASKRHGYDTSALKKEKGKYYSESKTKKRLFWIEAKKPNAKKKLEALVATRPIETEETSLKFSNWPMEEITRFRKGNASHAFLFELSFWGDLAKWLMLLQDAGEKYTIAYEGKPLPYGISLTFPGIGVWFYIAEVNWPWLIPSLHTVKSPLKVFDIEEEAVVSAIYDPDKKELSIQHTEIKGMKESDFEGIRIGDFLFVQGKGFYRRRSSPLFQKEKISANQIGETLSVAYKELEPFIKIHLDPIKANYSLHFDPEANLHIEFYLFKPGDLRSEKSSLFVPWVYLDGEGFYRVEDWLFSGKDKCIPKQDVADFVRRHRTWLHYFPGFQTHLGTLEAHLIYKVGKDGELSFEAELNFPEGFEEALHFEEWAYLAGQGFYLKSDASSKLLIHPGLKIPKTEVPSFIESHKEELTQVQGFLNLHPAILRTGLEIGLNAEGLISISPKREYAQDVDVASIQFFGNYAYVEGKGFSEIPPASRLPERYQEGVVISQSQEGAFLTYELQPLKPYIVHIDPKLERPTSLHLKIRRMSRERKKRGASWLIDVFYESEFGTIHPIHIWDAFQTSRKYLFSEAGLLLLKEPRFHWIRSLSRKQLDREKGMLRLSTLEWMRLTIFEDLKPPEGDDPVSVETRELFHELERLKTDQLLDISALKSQLRPYQEEGLSWLWFLYCHGLS
ncbi:MAG: hypothetical protein FJZ64_02100, partial [Chlamydiae bacterium]|nr:hypothetical protein [Chlamydiota bacterium]